MACIPAYDEEKTIARVILSAKPYVDKIIVGDDGSKDLTAKIAESLGATVVRHSHNQGKGAILRTLFQSCLENGAKVIVTIDGDGQHDGAEIPVVIKPVLEGTADISIGVRFHGKNEIPLYRKVGNKLLNYLTNIGNGSKLMDTQSGFRAYSRKAIEEITVRENGMGVDSQILLDAKKTKLRISESMISVKYGGGTSTHNPVRHLADVVLSIVRYAAEERPLALLGLPGLFVLTVGLAYGGLLMTIYVNSHQFIFAYALLAVAATLSGLFTIFVAIILFSVSNLLKRLRNERERAG